MKTLTLLRHAKSSWDDTALRDFDRPLNARGKRAAQTVGRAFRSEGLSFDQVLASPAVRVIETLDEVAEGYGALIDAEYDQKLYLAPVPALLEVIRGADDEAERLLIVGHNPGLESLTLALAGESALRSEVAVKYPTGTVAEIRFDIDNWIDVEEGRGRLTRFIRPRDLDPELGPDD